MRRFAQAKVLAVAAAVATLASCHVAPPLGPKPAFRQDLRAFGFPTATIGRVLGSFTDVNFLSNDLVLVTVNTRTYEASDETPPDEPDSKLLLFSLSQRKLIKTSEMPVEKASDSVQAAGENKFGLLNRDGLRLCSLELDCGPPFRAHGPLMVSPKGTRIAVGGRGRSDQRVLNGSNLAELQSFAPTEPKVVPGDDGLLVFADEKLYFKRGDAGDQRFVVNGGGAGTWPDARFLSEDTVAAAGSDNDVVIATTDGATRFRVPLQRASYLVEVSTASSGSVFSIHEAGYRGFRSILKALNIEQPFNIERVTVLATDSGKPRLRLSWDPRPYVGNFSRPALSPDGHRLAVIRHGFLEVFDVR